MGDNVASAEPLAGRVPDFPDNLDSFAPRPLQLYDQETKNKYAESFGRCVGALDKISMVWEIADPSSVRFAVAGRWEELIAKDYQLVGAEITVEYWMLGRKKKCAHPTAVNVCKDLEIRKRIWKLMGTDEALREKFPGLGFLVLESRPHILAAKPPATSAGLLGVGKPSVYAEGERPVFLAPDQHIAKPPYRIVVPSMSGDEWEILTMGGIFKKKGRMYGLIMVPTFGFDSRRDVGEGSTVPRSTLATGKSIFAFGELLGFLEDKTYSSSLHSWTTVKLNRAAFTPNLIKVPGSFGDAFVLTKVGKPTQDSTVWILTVTFGILIGRVMPLERRREGLVEDKPLVIQTASKLSPEDCGSWVVDASTRALVGIVMHIDFKSALFESITFLFDEIDPENHPTLPDPIAVSQDSNQVWKKKEKQDSSPLPISKRSSSQSFVGKLVYFCLPSGRKRMVDVVSQHQDLLSDSASPGQPIGTTDGKGLWELDGQVQEEWHRLEPQVEEIVRRTPSESGSMPTIMLHGLMMGRSRGQAVPTVLISSSSKVYATNLQKAIWRNGTLDTSSFEVTTLTEPIQKSPPETVQNLATNPIRIPEVV